MEEEKGMVAARLEATKEVGLKLTELIFGNPVITGILAITMLGTLVICVPNSVMTKEITIPAITGIGGLAGGMALGKLTK